MKCDDPEAKTCTKRKTKKKSSTREIEFPYLDLWQEELATECHTESSVISQNSEKRLLLLVLSASPPLRLMLLRVSDCTTREEKKFYGDKHGSHSGGELQKTTRNKNYVLSNCIPKIVSGWDNQKCIEKFQFCLPIYIDRSAKKKCNAANKHQTIEHSTLDCK